jgi:hypothetical protein
MSTWQKPGGGLVQSLKDSLLITSLPQIGRSFRCNVCQRVAGNLSGGSAARMAVWTSAVAQNVVRGLRSRRPGERHRKRLEVGVDIPSPGEPVNDQMVGMALRAVGRHVHGTVGTVSAQDDRETRQQSFHSLPSLPPHPE